MSDVQRAVGEDEPLMIAWKAYQATPEFSNTKQWAETMQLTIRTGPEIKIDHPHLQGSLWACFVAGYTAGKDDGIER